MSQQAPKPPEPLQKDTIEARIIKQKVWDRMWLKNEHFMGVIVGREGSAKSYTGIKIGEVADPTFEAWRVMFDPASFLKQLQEWKDNNETKGKIVIIDEAGVGVGVRTWYEKDQVLLNQVLQIIRDENMGVIFTLPRMEELDSQTKGRLHAYMKMVDKDIDNWARFKYMNWEPTRDGRNEVYKKYPRLRVNGYMRTIERLCLSPPSKELTEPYERRKTEFQNQEYQKVIDEMEDDVDDEKSVKEIAIEIAEGEIEDYVSQHSQNKTPYINQNLIRADYEVSQNDAKAIKDLLRRQFDESQLQAYV